MICTFKRLFYIFISFLLYSLEEKGIGKNDLIEINYGESLSKIDFFSLLKEYIPLSSFKNITKLLHMIQEEYNILLLKSHLKYDSILHINIQYVVIHKNK